MSTHLYMLPPSVNNLAVRVFLRASGLPLIGRSRVAENSFSRAFEEFQSELSDSSNRRGWSSASGSQNGIY